MGEDLVLDDHKFLSDHSGTRYRENSHFDDVGKEEGNNLVSLGVKSDMFDTGFEDLGSIANVVVKAKDTQKDYKDEDENIGENVEKEDILNVVMSIEKSE